MNAIFTVVTRSYLHFAITLLSSVAQHSPNAKQFCLVVDTDTPFVPELGAGCRVLQLSDLPITNIDEFCFQYEVVELCTATKPFVFSYLFDAGFSSVTYLDPDICVYSPLVAVNALIEAGNSIILTPHLIAPVSDTKQPGELDIRRSGTYNLGYCTVCATVSGYAFVSWWMAKLAHDCVVDMDRGVFVDQSWVDLVPGLFDGVAILRDPGYNVAYWNLAQRAITIAANGVAMVGQHKLAFFHFSGIDPQNTNVFSKYQDRFQGEDLAGAETLVFAYRKALTQNGAQKNAQHPYRFSQFDDGSPIPSVFRRAYLAVPDIRHEFSATPFSDAKLLKQLCRERTVDGLAPSLIMMAISHTRKDVSMQYPLTTLTSVMDFYQWVSVEGSKFMTPNLVDWHNEVVVSWRAGRINAVAVAQVEAPATSARTDLLAQQLFLRFLGRVPELAALLSYSALCVTLRGYFRAWVIIALSQESRSKPALLRRLCAGAVDAMKIALRATLVP
jgi:hypothetical protein